MDIAQKAELALRMVREARDLIYDTETSGVSWMKNYPVGHVFSEGSTSVYVPVRHGSGGNLGGLAKLPDGPEVEFGDSIEPHPFEVELAKAVEDRKRATVGPIIGHNLKFDCHFAMNVGVELGRDLVCTQNNEALLNEYSRSFSLGACAEAHGVTPKKGQELYDHISRVTGCQANRNAMGNFWKLAGCDPLAVEYAEGDGITTGELYYSQLKALSDQELGQVFKLESKLIWTLFKMERRGIKVDLGYLDELKAKMAAKIDEAKAKLPSDFNPRSPVQVRKIAEAAGHTDWPKTAAGNPSFPEKWLKTFDEGQAIVNIRKLTNMMNSFIEPLAGTHTYRGRVHCSLNQLKMDDKGTISGRLSCSNPNLQQVPKHNKELAKLIRKAFCADEGFNFIEADYSQCEPRMYGHYSKEQAIVNGYNANPPKDMHMVVAEMLNVDRDWTAKRMNMGIMTGMFPKTFAQHMGWPLEKAEIEWNKWFQMFPKIREFQKVAKNVLRSRGFVKTLLGRRCRLERPQFAYKGVSKIIQGGNADIIKFKLLELDKFLEDNHPKDAQLLMTVHDSIAWQSKDGDVGLSIDKEMTHIMADVQGPPFNLRIPFVVDLDRGKNWAEASFGEDEQ